MVAVSVERTEGPVCITRLEMRRRNRSERRPSSGAPRANAMPADHAGERRGDGLIGDEIARSASPLGARSPPRWPYRSAMAKLTARKRSGGVLVTMVTTRPMNHGTRAVGERDAQLNHEQGREQPLRLAGKVPQEGDQSRRRFGVVRRRCRRQESFKKCKHFGWLQAPRRWRQPQRRSSRAGVSEAS